MLRDRKGVVEAMAYSTDAPPRRPDFRPGLTQQRIPLAVAISIALQWAATLWVNQLEAQTGLSVGYSGWSFLFMAAVSLGTLLGVGVAWGFYALFAFVLAAVTVATSITDPDAQAIGGALLGVPSLVLIFLPHVYRYETNRLRLSIVRDGFKVRYQPALRWFLVGLVVVLFIAWYTLTAYGVH